MTRLARLILVSLGVAFAVWLTPASIHIVDWTADGPVRVALFAPLWQLWIALAIAALLAGIVLGLSGVGHGGQAATLSDTMVAPLGLMWLWVIPYLPWIPDRAPSLLVLAGPLRWGIAALAVAGSAMSLIPVPEPVEGTARVRWLPGRHTVFALSLAIYLFFGLWSAAAVGPGADEPHYLVITQSLLRDHDLAIENNHARGDYREYFGGELRPDFLRRGLNEVIYSIHAPGLPALLVPAYAVAGYRGAVVMLCLFGALAALAIYDLAALLAGPGTAWLAWAATCLTVPFVPHSWLIFPEMPGALLVAWAALWLYAPLPTRSRTWIWRGTALAMLPWLHTKFVILLAAMAAALLLRLWRTPRAAAALATPVIASVVLWIGSFYLLYGVFDPQIPYGDFPKLYVLAANIPRGVLGLLFDQKFGLLVYAPIYLLAVAGAWIMVRRPEWRLFAARADPHRGRVRRELDPHVHVVGRLQRAGAISGPDPSAPRADDRGRAQRRAIGGGAVGVGVPVGRERGRGRGRRHRAATVPVVQRAARAREHGRRGTGSGAALVPAADIHGRRYPRAARTTRAVGRRGTARAGDPRVGDALARSPGRLRRGICRAHRLRRVRGSAGGSAGQLAAGRDRADGSSRADARARRPVDGWVRLLDVEEAERRPPARAEHGARVADGWCLVDGSGAARRTVRSATRTFRRAHCGRRCSGRERARLPFRS